MDYVETLTLGESLIADEAVEATLDADAWRAVAKQAIDALHDVTTERDQFRARYHAALDELRRYRNMTGSEAVPAGHESSRTTGGGRSIEHGRAA